MESHVKVWHAHMMFPDDYRDACSALNSGDLIKHDPRAAFDDPLEKNERLRRTKEVYKIIFGQEAPHEIWPFTSGYSDFQVFVKNLSGQTLAINVNPPSGGRVEELKKKIEVNFHSYVMYTVQFTFSQLHFQPFNYDH